MSKLDKAGEYLDRGIDQEMRTTYTALPAILEEVEQVNGHNRGIVHDAHDRDRSADDIPILTMSAGDGYGVDYAIEAPCKGVMVFSNVPLDESLETSDYEEDISKHRHHSFEDGFFVPGVWHDDEEGLDAALEEFLHRTPSGTEINIDADGDYYVRHVDGHTVEVTEDSVEILFDRDGDDPIRISVDEQSAEITAPDERNEFDDDAESTMSIDEDGQADLDGRVSIGDSDAHREDPENENTDSDDPRPYERVDEPVVPIADPSEGDQTDYRNPTTATMRGPIHSGWFEHRGFVLERRDEDPDPDETNSEAPEYVDLPDELEDELGEREIPGPYLFWHNEDEEVKILEPGEDEPETLYP